MKDLTNIRFGRLLVLRKSDTQVKGRVSWHCLCDCGNHVDALSKNLLSKGTKSCGCLAKESAKSLAKDLSVKKKQIEANKLKEIQKKEVETRKEKYYVEGVDTSALTAKKRKDNKSGIRGVSWDKSRNRWKADICVGNERKYVGRFKTLEDAKEARELAEKEYFKPILDKKAEKENK